MADSQRFAHHRLMRGLRGIQAKNEITAGLIDLVIQFNREFESEHRKLSVNIGRMYLRHLELIPCPVGKLSASAHILTAIFATQKATDELGFSPDHSLRSGVFRNCLRGFQVAAAYTCLTIIDEADLKPKEQVTNKSNTLLLT